MAFSFYNPNPKGLNVGDCVIRGVSKALNTDWYKTYSELVVQGYSMCDMPSSNNVWGQYLKSKGYRRYIIPNTCPDCYTVKDFCADNPKGKFVLGTGSHVICVIDGDYYDAWDSGNENPIYYWQEVDNGSISVLLPTDANAANATDADAGTTATTGSN